MMLDARKGDHSWYIYDAERCAPVPHVLWVDDATNHYFQLFVPHRFAIDGELDGQRLTARKIQIYPDRKLIIINPVEDHEEKSTLELVGAPVL